MSSLDRTPDAPRIVPTRDRKSVIVLDEALPPGDAANAAAILGASLGHRVDALVGPDARDAEGGRHAGIITVPLPVLRADAAGVADVRRRALERELLVVGFTELAASHGDHGEYLAALSATEPGALAYRGVALHGPRKAVNSVVGSLPLLR